MSRNFVLFREIKKLFCEIRNKYFTKFRDREISSTTLPEIKKFDVSKISPVHECVKLLGKRKYENMLLDNFMLSNKRLDDNSMLSIAAYCMFSDNTFSDNTVSDNTFSDNTLSILVPYVI
jgi:hypothetical protein